MADIVKQILAKPIQLADQVTKAADDVNSNRSECLEVKAKTEKLAGLLRQAARASNDLYERPTRRIIDDTEQVLDKALGLIFKCRANGLRRVFTIIPCRFPQNLPTTRKLNWRYFMAPPSVHPSR
ncbi:hypothetical protein LOK49_LG03G03773 [Camellia lanceoleosa]|uniref:Uncharacterized protein n=1 Tax=Camellia lanceoleosa TaxID=1840588 RepID=A0ACC0IAP8_9ERIC|nr:hypothetical protein LOK49_LG03G03773 [Camellia lanceoleosa]